MVTLNGISTVDWHELASLLVSGLMQRHCQTDLSFHKYREVESDKSEQNKNR